MWSVLFVVAAAAAVSVFVAAELFAMLNRKIETNNMRIFIKTFHELHFIFCILSNLLMEIRINYNKASVENIHFNLDLELLDSSSLAVLL